MAIYTVRKGKWYIARISLSGFNRFATNGMVAAKLEDRAATENGNPGIVRREGNAVGTDGLRYPGWRDQPAG